MKKYYIFISALFVFALFSCSTSFGEGGNYPSVEENPSSAPAENIPFQPVVTPLRVTNLAFNSLDCKLQADVNMADGQKITVSCNGLSQTAVAKNKKISLTFETPFYKGIKGGKAYDVKFSADGYSDASEKIGYWPKVICRARAKGEVNVYCGGNNNFVAPEIALENYDSDSVVIQQSFNVYSNFANNNLLGSGSADGWTLDNVKAFLMNKENVGKSVLITSVVTPSNGDSNLKETISVVYHCKYEEEAALVQINKDYERYEALLYKELYNYDSESAGGNVSFQWQLKNNDDTYSDIEGAVDKVFRLTSSNAPSLLNGYIRVKVTQKFENPSKEDLTLYSDQYFVSHSIKEAQVYYNGELYEGNTFDAKKVCGKVSDELGNWHDINSDDLYLISELDVDDDYYLAKASKTFRIQIDSSDFYMDVLDVFATVRQVLKSENLPKLKTASGSVESGLAEFESINSDLEVSYDGGATFEDFPVNEFVVPENKILYLRKRSSGTPNTEGYKKESEACQLIVKDENIGKKTSGDGLIDGISLPTLTMLKSEENGIVRITAKLDIRDPEEYDWKYDWLFSDAPLSEWSGKGVSIKNNALVIDTSKLGKDTYQIYCQVSITRRSTSYDFVTVSAQIPLAVY